MAPVGYEEANREGALPEVPHAAHRRPVRRLRSFTTAFERYGLVLLLIALVVAFSVDLPNTFFTARNFQTIVDTQTVVVVLALAILFPLSAGDFDLSVSANLVLSSLVAVLVANHYSAGLATCIVVALVVGATVGAVNACLVVGFGLNGFIATLATMTIASAIALGLSNEGEAVILQSSSLANLMNARLFTLRAATYYAWAVALVVWYVFERTPLGRHLRVTGSAREAARLSGLSVRGLRAFSYIVAGALVGVAAVLLLGTVRSADPTSTGDYLLEPYAAVFLGTATINLGRFNVGGTLVAIYIVIVGATGLQLLGVAPWSSELFQGLVLLAGLLFARLSSHRSQEIIGHGASVNPS